MLANSERTKIVSFLIDKGILIEPDFLNLLNEEFNINFFYDLLKGKIDSDTFLILNKFLYSKINDQNIKLDINWYDLDKSNVSKEKEKDGKTYDKFIEFIESNTDFKKEQESKSDTYVTEPVKVISSYSKESKKREIQDFVKLFNSRLKKIEKMFQGRRELQNLTSINRIKCKKEKETVSFIGIVYDKHTTKNNNIILTLEDSTSDINILINKNSNLYPLAKDIVLDEVVGVIGVNNGDFVYATNIICPDIPLQNELKKSNEEGYALFLSDLHVGSKNFLDKEFNKFIKWIRCEVGSEEQRRLASLVKYIFIAGDLVDGIGIYPEQDSELYIKDIFMQYQECANLLSQIPSRIKIIICPGNHDAMRIAEPQPALYKDFTKPLWDMPNIVMVSNPSYINFHSSQTFPGYNVLLYHGYSFDYYAANVESIKANGGYDRADLIIKFMLQRRHLAPTHTSTLYIPDSEEDPLVIDKIPDFFVTGHIHKTSVSNYRNVTLICGSCWQSKTSFQEKVGHHPEPCRIPIANLQTREVKILRF